MQQTAIDEKKARVRHLEYRRNKILSA